MILSLLDSKVFCVNAYAPNLTNEVHMSYIFITHQILRYLQQSNHLTLDI